MYIEIEDLAANALIEFVEKKERRGFLFRGLDDYGACVIDVLNRVRKTKAILVVSRESQMAMLEDHTDMYEPHLKKMGQGIRLKEGISSIQLWIQRYFSACVIFIYRLAIHHSILRQYTIGSCTLLAYTT